MKKLTIAIVLVVATINVFGQGKPRFRSEADSLKSVIYVQKITLEETNKMLFKLAVKNDSITTAYNKLLAEYKNFAIYVRKTLTKVTN